MFLKYSCYQFIIRQFLSFTILFFFSGSHSLIMNFPCRCPYYMSRDLHKTVGILFSPYNYLIDPARRDSLTGIQWDNAVLIFDEAHNLVRTR